MELSVSQQGLQFLIAVSVGLVLGCIYDFLWGMRKGAPFLTGLLDLVMGLMVLVGNWILFFYVGDGEYRLFFLPGIGVGYFLWSRLLRKGFRRGILWLLRLLFLPMTITGRFLEKIIEKTKKFLKNPFSKRKKSVKINRKQFLNGGEIGE